MKEFPTEDVLSTVTGTIVTERLIGAVYEVCNWATGESLFTHQLPRVCKELRAVMLKLRPELRAAINESDQIDENNWRAFRDLWVDRYGPTMAVPKLNADEHERIDPLSELAEKVHPDNIIVVETP